MALERFTKDMEIISKLDDEPNDVGGLSASALKARFDEGGIAVKEYINDTLLPNIEDELSDCPKKEDLDNVVLGQIPDGSITAEKLDPSVFGSVYDKESVLSDETKALYGLGADAVPDNVLSLLSRFPTKFGKEYLWRVREEREVFEYSLGTNNIFLYLKNSGSYPSTTVKHTIEYSDEVYVGRDGSVYLKEPIQTLQVSYSDYSAITNNLVGKYVKTAYNYDYPYSSIQRVVNATVTIRSNASSGTYWYYLQFTQSEQVTGHFEYPTIGFVNSDNPNTYQTVYRYEEKRSFHNSVDVYNNNGNDTAVQTIKYADALTFNPDTGEFTATNENTLSGGRTEMLNAITTTLRNKYVYLGEDIMFGSASNNVDLNYPGWYYFPSNTAQYSPNSGSNYYCYAQASNPYIEGIAAVAVPVGYIYDFLGEIGSKANIACGSYTGTGKYGVGFKNSLTFDFVPKVLFIKPYGQQGYFGFWVYPDTIMLTQFTSSSGYPNNVVLDGTTLYWYNTTNEAYQFNYPPQTTREYYYVAFG